MKKIDPKGSQKEAKRDKKSNQRLQDELGAPMGRFSPLWPHRPRPSWRKINPKSKKDRPNNRIFFDRLLDPKMERKRFPKPTEMTPKMVQNRSQKRAQRKNGQSMKTNNSPTFWFDFGCLRGSKIEERI